MTPLMKESAINLRNAYGDFVTTDDLSSIRIGFKQLSQFRSIEFNLNIKIEKLQSTAKPRYRLKPIRQSSLNDANVLNSTETAEIELHESYFFTDCVLLDQLQFYTNIQFYTLWTDLYELKYQWYYCSTTTCI